jgi:hypothetical protein
VKMLSRKLILPALIGALTVVAAFSTELMGAIRDSAPNRMLGQFESGFRE